MTKIKKKKFKKSLIIIFILLIVTLLFFYIKYNELQVDIVENVELNIGEEYYILKGVINIKNGEIITQDEKIDTSSVGNQKIEIEIKDKLNNIKKYTYDVNVIDKNVQEEPTETKDENTNDKNNNNESNNSKNKSDEKDSVDTSKNNVIKTSKGFIIEEKEGATYIDGTLIANKTYSLPSTYGNGLTKETKEAFDKMAEAAKLDGIKIWCQSGFRSYDTQKRIYNNYVNRDGKEKADTFSARPGHSEHQTGLCCDINDVINSTFDDTKEAKWASENAYKFGLALRFPKGKTEQTGYKYESWHFRYVGEELATKLYNNGDWISLEEYFGITSEYKD